jgi:hypothetical protein
MLFIVHRINTRKELKGVPEKYGVEVDIRSHGNDLVVNHEPFVSGENLNTWITAYNHSMLILNVKEEGLETRLLSLMKKWGIEDFFFLDQSFPFLIKTSSAGERRCAARVSEYEPVDTALSLAPKIDWVWVDCFTKFPLTKYDAERLKKRSLKLCLVSPELLERFGENEIPNIYAVMTERRIQIDAVCTKFPEVWEKMFDTHPD